MKKYISVSLAFALALSYNSYAFANNINNTNISQNISNKTVFFENNGSKYSILSDNSVALESFSYNSEKNVVLPNTISYNGKNYFLKEIKENAFPSNNVIENITLNDSLEKINNNPFSNLSSLKNIKVSNNSINFLSINGVLFSKNKETLISYPNGKLEKSYAIPLNVLKIGNSAFKNNSILETVSLTPFVQEIKEYAFANTSNLIEVKSAVSVKKVGNFAFSGSSLKKIAFSNILESLGTNVFENSNIENFIFPEKILAVPEYTFYNCKNLKSVSLHNKLSNIKKSAFEGSSIPSINAFPSLVEIEENAFKNSSISYLNNANNLKILGNQAFVNSNLKEIFLPQDFTSLGDNVFLNTDYLEEITVYESNHFFESYNNSLFTKGKKELLFVPTNLNLKNFKLPDETSKINITSLFANNKLESFEVSKDNKYFSVIDGVLYSKDEKTLIKFPTLKKVENFVIPNTVEKIAPLAFENAENISGSFTIGQNVEEISKNAFYDSSISEFFVSNNNPYFSSLNGILYNKDMSVLYKCPPNSSRKDYVLSNKLKTISSYAFTNCKVGTVTTNDNLINIDDYAFFNATIDKITLNYNLKNIGNSAFENSNLIKIEIPFTVEKIGDNAFKDCTKLTEITFKCNNIKSIGNNSFENCDLLNKINIPKTTSNKFKDLLKNTKANVNYLKEV